MGIAQLKPQDVVVALKLLSLPPEEPWTQQRLAEELFMSTSEVNHALKRLEFSKLYTPLIKCVVEPRLFNFLVHGVPYVFPAVPGPVKHGLPTSISASPLRGRFIMGEEDELVWEYGEGGHKGHSVEPLYKTAPRAAARDPRLHEWLAVVDALRVGRARERQAAAQRLEQWLKA
jgi:hypothetical protein